MPGTFKTEGVVLRSIRYGEADRVLHLYTADRGRVGAVAKGVRRVKSRLGGRLEPLSRVRLVLHEGRGELCTISQADTVHAHAPCASAAPRSSAAPRPARRCCACSTPPSPTARPTTCSATSSRCSTPTRAAASRAQALAFRLKLLLAAGFAPELAACAACGEARAPGRLLAERRRRGLRRLRGGLVPARRGGARVPGRGAGAPARRGARGARARALPQADRAIAETLEHHAHVRLRRVRRELARRISAVAVATATSSSTTSPRARATCASCSAARARTSPR